MNCGLVTIFIIWNHLQLRSVALKKSLHRDFLNLQYLKMKSQIYLMLCVSGFSIGIPHFKWDANFEQLNSNV